MDYIITNEFILNILSYQNLLVFELSQVKIEKTMILLYLFIILFFYNSGIDSRLMEEPRLISWERGNPRIGLRICKLAENKDPYPCGCPKI